MLEYIKNMLLQYNIESVECIPLSICRLTRQDKLERAGFSLSDKLYAVIFTVPYYTEHGNKNISSYAIPRDYHLFFEELFSDIIPKLKKSFPDNRFHGFSDNSPIDERHAAALAGLGRLGENRLLITEKHSSYVFIGEIITDLVLECKQEHKIEYCTGCGKCLSTCPIGEIGECLSALTQKKGKLSEKEENMIKKYRSCWGCDICQEVCPHTERAKKDRTIFTNIEFFMDSNLPVLSSQAVFEMSDEEFSLRAYSWRKRETVMRNLTLLEDKK